MKSRLRSLFGDDRVGNRETEASEVNVIRHLPVVNQILPSAVFCLTLTSFLLVGNISAQPTPDTLDWHRYHPLAVGNVWEYQVAEGEPLLRREKNPWERM